MSHFSIKELAKGTYSVPHIPVMNFQEIVDIKKVRNEPVLTKQDIDKMAVEKKKCFQYGNIVSRKAVLIDETQQKHLQRQIGDQYVLGFGSSMKKS